MFSRSVIDNSRNVIDDSRVILQLVASFTIIIYACQFFIAQATGVGIIKLLTAVINSVT
jgi:hypothetical protein